MTSSKNFPAKKPSKKSEINQFLKQVNALGPTRKSTNSGRLLFAMDATMSRQPTWDQALHVQADMFKAAMAVGSLEIQLAYFRGFGEFRASKWLTDERALADAMTQVQCRGGHTQIERVLNHALKCAQRDALKAVVYVGDCVEENADDLAALAGQLGVFQVPIFAFQEGYDPNAEAIFRELSRLSGGAFSRFSATSAVDLRALLSAVAVFVAGGQDALSDYSRNSTSAVKGLLTQLRD